MTARLTPASRTALLDELETGRFDLIVIGGGIAGAGIAREASLRGLRVALCEASDFGAGTSSRSSKLIHGGLRYLAQGRIGFVRRTARERMVVHSIAPHLARPCWMVVPTQHRFEADGVRAALSVYERLGGVEAADSHVLWQPRDLIAREPSLRLDTIRMAVAYREFLTDDVRLVLAVLRSAASLGATVASRLPVRALVRRGGRVGGVVAHCPMTDREIEVRAGVVVNAAGPWVDHLARLASSRHSVDAVLSKGVHLVLDRQRLPLRHPVLCGAADGRWVFAVPRADVVYVGTTDTSSDGERREWPRIDRADIDYLLEPLGRYFAVDPPTVDDVVAAWAGLRTLPVRHVRRRTAMSREAAVEVGPSRMISVTGGKLTGFSGLSSDVVDHVGRLLGREVPRAADVLRLPGATVDPLVDDERLHHLYGSEACDVLRRGSEPLVEGAPVRVGEVDWAVDVEAATTLEDVIYRRALVAWFQPRHRLELADAVADRMTTLLGWTPACRAAEVRAVCDRFASELEFTSGGRRVPMNRA